MKRMRTIAAVFKKDFIQLVRYKTWIIQLIIWPLIIPIMYILSGLGMAGKGKDGFKGFVAATGTENFMAFIVVGTLAWELVNSIMWGFGGYLRNEQMRGTLESTWLCPIKRFDILIGGGLFHLMRSVIQVVVSLLEYRFIYFIHFEGNIINWFIAIFSMFPAIYGLGLLFASLVLWAKQANSAINVARGIMMMLCGITFPIAVMPQWLRIISQFLPYTFGIEAVRQVMVKGETLKAAAPNMYMCVFEGIILIILGRLAFMKTENKVRSLGSLERF